MLNHSVFQAIHQQLGPLKLGLFASWLTTLLPRYYSWRPDPEAEAADAFTQNWAQSRGYANPPWYLINCFLHQVSQQQARIVMVMPWWSTQAWFPVILAMLEDYPRLLPSRRDLVNLPTGQEFIMPQEAPHGPSQELLHITRHFWRSFRAPLRILEKQNEPELQFLVHKVNYLVSVKE